jgi:hypothetical protein
VSRDVSLPFEIGGPEDGQGQAAILLHTTVNGRPVAVADYWYRRWHNSWDSDAANRRQMVRRTVTTVRLPLGCSDVLSETLHPAIVAFGCDNQAQQHAALLSRCCHGLRLSHWRRAAVGCRKCRLLAMTCWCPHQGSNLGPAD